MFDYELRVKKNASFAIADAILAMLMRGGHCIETENENSELKDFGLTATAEAWNNCREQGYILGCYVGKGYFQICFAEHRNCDSPTIWHAEGRHRPPGHGPEDGEWQNLGANSVDDAVEKILALVEDYVQKITKREAPADRKGAVAATKRKAKG